ncbi:SPOR domain-containing protein [Oryzicola mucosus]|uniref:SPOR domain-containing protein n=1 Tax=Oryzicola mucosus TaxID=2767425 RepID=A0A8J6PY67_9HYPH|nr:SPOR domain-containing protein [Oryzicola mucosus]MBD0416558.1 SPOR domain-containing protein [Oryzicola mucosus]
MANRTEFKIADRNNDVADDDPFAELTRIMGFDPREPVSRSSGVESTNREPSFEDDYNVDLEKELLGDFGQQDDFVAAPAVYHREPESRLVEPQQASAAEDDFADFEFATLDEALEPVLQQPSEPVADLPPQAADFVVEQNYADEPVAAFDDAFDAALAEDALVSDDFEPVAEERYAPVSEERYEAVTERRYEPEFSVSAQPDSEYADHQSADAPQPELPLREVAFSENDHDFDFAVEPSFEDELSETASSEPVLPVDVEPQWQAQSYTASSVSAPVAAPVAQSQSLEDELNALLGNMTSPASAPQAVQPIVETQPVMQPEPDLSDLDWDLEVDVEDDLAPVAAAHESSVSVEEPVVGAEEPEWDLTPLDAAPYGETPMHEPVAEDHDFDLSFDDDAIQSQPEVVAPVHVAPAVAPAPTPAVRAGGILSSMRSGAARAWGLSTPVAPRSEAAAEKQSYELAYAPAVAAMATPVAASYAEPEVEAEAYHAEEPAAYEVPTIEPVAKQSADLDLDLDFGAEVQEDLEAELLAAVSTFEEAPEIETLDVPEQAVALADDLDIPEIDFKDETQPAAPYDDFDNEFADLIGEMTAPETPAAPPQQVYAAASGAAAGYAASYDRRPAASADNAASSAHAQPSAAASATSGQQGSYDFDDLFTTPPATDSLASDDLDYDPDFDESMSNAEYGEQEPRSRRGMMLAAAVAAVAIIGGVGAFAFSFGGGSDGGEPSLVRADTTPIKVRPENPGGTVIPNQDNKVYDRVAGASGGAAGQQTLVNEAEEPVDIAPPAAELEETTEDVAGATPKGEDRIEQVIQDQEDTQSSETAAVAPRKVRTMVVRSDGSLAPREEPEPVNVAAAEPADPAPQRVGTPSNESTGAVTPTAPASALPAANAPAASTPASAPVAPQRPVAQPAAPAQPEQVAAAAPAAAAAAGAWSMQIASQPSEAAAQSTYQDLSRRYASVLGGKQASIVKAEIAGKGTFWRVRVPAGSRNEAISLCESYKSAGGNCFVSR